MLEYIVKRLALATLTLFAVLFVSYALTRLAPGDAAKSSFLGESAEASQGVSADKGGFIGDQSVRKRLMLDRPIYEGFFVWLGGVVSHGDMGVSVAVDKGRPVVELVLERLPVTLSLNLWAILITYLLAIPIGVYSAVRSGTKLDRGMTGVLFLLYSVPSFWLALMLQATLCEGGKFPIFPLKGLTVTDTWDLSTWQVIGKTAAHYALPVFCLSYAGFAGLSRFARAGMIDTIRQDYIRTARAKGLPARVVVFKHAFRNAVIILITLFAELLPGLIGGSIIVEYIFSVPGMGSLSMLALSSRDIPLLMALFAFGGALTLLGILLADVLYVLADPRVTFSERRG